MKKILVVALMLSIPFLSVAQVLSLPLTVTPSPNDRFGLVFVNGVDPGSNQPYGDGVNRYQRAKESGAKWTRWVMYWNRIQETSPDRFAYSSQDEVANSDIQNGFEVDAVLLGTPSWAGSDVSVMSLPSPSGSPARNHVPLPGSLRMQGYATDVPIGLDQPLRRSDGSINPENRWGYFVYNTVSRYKPGGVLAREKNWPEGRGVRAWELWNEPDWAAASGGFWGGGVEYYFQLLKVGYLAAKAADPSASVLIGGLYYWGDQGFLPRLLDRILQDSQAKSNNYYFDAVPLHLYISSYHLYNVPLRLRDEMTRRGMGTKPIWVNETNLPVYNDTDPSTNSNCSFYPFYQGTMEEQAAFIIQAFALGLAAGVERIFAFQSYDDNVGEHECYGLMRNNYTARPAYQAFQTAAYYFVNPQSATKTSSGNIDKVTLFSQGRGKLTVVWNNASTPAQAILNATTETATLVSKTGATVSLTARNNRFTLDLPAATHRDPLSREFDLGGDPFILVEPVYTLPSSRVDTLPLKSSTLSFPVRWSRLDSKPEAVVYDVQYKEGATGTWTDWLTGTSLTTAAFDRVQGGRTYYFRSRAMAADGSVEPYPEGEGDTFTTIALVLDGTVIDNRGNPIPQAHVFLDSLSPLDIKSPTTYVETDKDGGFSLELPKDGTYTLTAERVGFGHIPIKTLEITAPLSYVLRLPPTDDVVRNGNFEEGLSSWAVGGTVRAQTFRHTGQLGATISGTAYLSQTLEVPSGTNLPTLSFFYRSPNAGPQDRLEVGLWGTTRTITATLPLTGDGWQHGWLDISSVQGRAILRLSYNGMATVWLDEISLGPAPNRVYVAFVRKGQSAW